MGWRDYESDPDYDDCDICESYKYSCRCDDKWCANRNCEAWDQSVYPCRNQFEYRGLKSVRKSQCNCKPNDKLGECSDCEERCSQCVCDDEYCRDRGSCNKNDEGLLDNFTDRHSECCGERHEYNLQNPEFLEYENNAYACDVGCKICAGDPEELCHPTASFGKKISFAEARLRITGKYAKRRERAESRKEKLKRRKEKERRREEKSDDDDEESDDQDSEESEDDEYFESDDDDYFYY